MTEDQFQEFINNTDLPDYSHIKIDDLKALTHEQIMKFDPTNETTERLEAFNYWLGTEYKGPIPKSIGRELIQRDLFEFMDKQKFTKKEMRDVEYIAEHISHWGDYGGLPYEGSEAIKLAKEYIKRRS